MRAADTARVEAARRKLDDCDERLVRYRAALDRGGDPTVIGAWIAEVQADRLAAQQTVALHRETTLDAADVRRIIEQLGDVRTVIANAAPELKTNVYAALGISLTYRPYERKVLVKATPAPCAGDRVGGGT